MFAHFQTAQQNVTFFLFTSLHIRTQVHTHTHVEMLLKTHSNLCSRLNEVNPRKMRINDKFCGERGKNRVLHVVLSFDCDVEQILVVNLLFNRFLGCTKNRTFDIYCSTFIQLQTSGDKRGGKNIVRQFIWYKCTMYTSHTIHLNAMFTLFKH